MIRVITIEREYGSGGANIARKLAERLGWQLWDRRLTEEIARRLDCMSKQWTSMRSEQTRCITGCSRHSCEGVLGALNAPRLGMVDADCIRQAAEQVVTIAAKAGNSVIVGRGSAYFLKDRGDVFHVFVYAPFEAKVQRLRAERFTEKEAVELVKTVDSDRAEYIKKYFDIEWPDRYAFQLMINSALGDELVVQVILDSVAELDKQSAGP